MTTMVWAYVGYLTVCVGVTIWVGRTLRKNGRVFVTGGLEEENAEHGDSFAHLLVVGFYLINFGVISFALKYGGRASDAQTAIELLSTKVGLILVVLGVMHFMIIGSLSSARRERDQRNKRAAWDRLEERGGKRDRVLS